MRIFGDGFHGEAADLFQCATADNRTGAAEERGVPVVIALLNRAVEQRPFIRDIAPDGEVAFERIRRIEIVRRLHQCQPGIFQEPAHGGLQENTRGDVVTVKHRDQLTLRQLHRMVQVAGFGMGVVVTGDITHANVCREDRKLTALPVIKQVDLHFVARVVDTLRGQHRITHHVQRFVIGWDVDVNRWPFRHIVGQRNNFTLQRPDGLQIVEQQEHPDVDFRQK
ncbi:hypothetical protein D3C78_842870 [compost metagenome]